MHYIKHAWEERQVVVNSSLFISFSTLLFLICGQKHDIKTAANPCLIGRDRPHVSASVSNKLSSCLFLLAHYEN